MARKKQTDGENGTANKGRSTRGRLPLKSLLIEVFSIVLGVLLALAMNEWREHRSQQAQAQSALQNIENELRANQELLEIIHANNSASMDTTAGELTASQEKRNFIPGLQLRETAWQTLLSTGVSNYVEYETVLRLSEAYSMQEIYKQTGRQLIDAAMNVAAYATVNQAEVDDTQFQKQFIDYFQILLTLERELLKSYEAVIEHLQQKGET